MGGQGDVTEVVMCKRVVVGFKNIILHGLFLPVAESLSAFLARCGRSCTSRGQTVVYYAHFAELD